jgi:hypothetical protein
MSRIHCFIAGILLAGGLAACSDVPVAQRDSQRQAAYDAAAGAPVDHFNFFDLYSWEPLGVNQVAVYTRPNQAWLLSLYGPCPNLPFATFIGLTSSLHQVSINFDRVLTGRGEVPCTIAKIQPVDLTKLKDIQTQQRQIHAEERAAAAAPATASSS